MCFRAIEAKAKKAHYFPVCVVENGVLSKTFVTLLALCEVLVNPRSIKA